MGKSSFTRTLSEQIPDTSRRTATEEARPLLERQTEGSGNRITAPAGKDSEHAITMS